MDEVLKHPIFWSKDHVCTPEEIEENEYLQQIQAMKYDDDDTPDEQAEAYKKDGTFHLKAKLYHKACLAYSKAISVKPNKTLLVRTLCLIS